jgi:hypothetical protein
MALRRLESFDKSVAAGREALAGPSDDHLAKVMPVHYPGSFEVARGHWAIVQSRMMNHSIHHPGQLRAYLR